MTIGSWFAGGFKNLGLWIAHKLWACLLWIKDKLLSGFESVRDSFASSFDKLGWSATHVLFYLLIIGIVFIILKIVFSRR